jgi:23S rRNA (cytosine1962-C5)-methyltransferase
MAEREAGGDEAHPGDLVRVVGRKREPVGYGLWNPHSQIALRILTQQAEAPAEEFWKGRLSDAVRLRDEVLGLGDSTTACRLVHAESDGLSGLVIDRLDDVLSVECFSLGIYQRIEALLRLAHPLAGTRHHRVRVDERIAQAERFSGSPLESEALPPAITIQEHGIRYRVRFEGAHKTGFFCDQRENREKLAGFCRGQNVLDLCCYSGGFGLNARLRGEAREVTCVDLDEKALALARENMNLNQVRVGLVHSDAFGYLRQMGANRKSYGVVVLDPPKLIASRDEVSLGKRKYFDMNLLAMRVVEPGGMLLTCSCSGLLGAEEFLGILRAAAREAGRSARMLTMTGAAADHPVALDVPETSYLKACWLLMGEPVGDGAASAGTPE